MKARNQLGSEHVYCSSDSYEKSSRPLGSKSRETRKKGEYENGNNRICGYSSNGGVPLRKAVVSEEFAQENDLQPLHFDTQQVLEETPAIFKSLNSGSRGPDTFVYLSSSKPSSVPQNEDPCKTFVISPGNSSFISRKNSLNQNLAVNGFGSKSNSAKTANNEYLSYVIEKDGGHEGGKMSEESSDGNQYANDEIFKNEDAVDRASAETSEKLKSEIVEERNVKNHADPNDSSDRNSTGKDNSREGEVCDKKVQCKEENAKENTSVLSFNRTITGKKEQAFAKLQDELQKAHRELKLKDEEVARLTRIREDVERELEELTASLFQEAHRMVSKAKEKQAASEKSLQESQMKVDVLTAEVVALKTLVLTSTPSRPNPHLHPQIGKEEGAGGVNLFSRKHRRSPSHFNLKYGRENSPPDSPVKDKTSESNAVTSPLENRDISEVDPTVHKEFLNWSLNCKLDKTDPFIDRIYREDINLCLDFSNRELAEEVQKAIETRNIFIEAVTDKSKTIFPRKCALLEATRQCHYRMKLGDQDVWYNISQMCRNRIIAVCDFINYLRYIDLGLVKSSAHDMYWEIMRLRKEMILARLGLSSPSS